MISVERNILSRRNELVKKRDSLASGTIDGAAPIKFCSFFLTLIEEKGTINVLGSIETNIKIV